MRAAAAAWVCVAAWAWLSLLQARGDTVTAMTAWQKVLVEPTRFTANVTQTPMTLGRTLCAAMCGEKGWCSVWCFAAPTNCLLTSLTVSPSYVPTDPTDARHCYIELRKDLAVGAVASSSPTNSSYPVRVAAKLVDGYYARDIEDCARVTYAAPDGAWFQFDLGFVYTVTEVVLWAQSNGYVVEFFRDMEVRVGVSPAPSPGVFSTFTLLGTFPGPGVEGQVVQLRVAKPLKARYVSIQRMTKGNLQICHLEIR